MRSQPSCDTMTAWISSKAYCWGGKKQNRSWKTNWCDRI